MAVYRALARPRLRHRAIDGRLVRHVQLAHGQAHPLLAGGSFERPRPGEVAHGGDHGVAVQGQVARFVELCRRMGLLSKASVAIDGSKFKAVNNRDKNFTSGKIERRRKQLEESVSRYLSQLDTADRQDPSETVTLKKVRIKEKLEKLQSEIAKLAAIEKYVLASPDQQISLTDPDSRSMATSGRGSGVVGYNVQTAVDTEII